MTLEEFIALCCCPVCRLDLTVNKTASTVNCPNGHTFRLINQRIPLLLPAAGKTKDHETDFSNFETSKSFSRQWRMRGKDDNIWGWNKEEMKERFLKNIGLTSEDLLNKRILDLGCGHGVYCVIMAELGAEVIGFDISNGFTATEARLEGRLKSKINFIQGDVFHFPLKEEIVDCVWSSGVLHHTPDTKRAFHHVCRVVKRGGRFYLWLYKNVYYTPLLKAIRRVTTKLSEKVLIGLCYAAAPFFALTKFLLTALKMNYRPFEKRTLKENALSIHDTLAPPYRWHHHKDEIMGWFREEGFSNVTVVEDSALGYGIYADRA